MGLSAFTVTVWGEPSFSSFPSTSGVGLVSEGLLFEEKLLNTFGVGIGLDKKRGGCQDHETQDVRDTVTTSKTSVFSQNRIDRMF